MVSAVAFSAQSHASAVVSGMPFVWTFGTECSRIHAAPSGRKTTAAPFQSSLARNAAVKEESEDLFRKKIKDEDVEQLLEKLSTEEYAKLAKIRHRQRHEV